jgi:hypothetical protein
MGGAQLTRQTGDMIVGLGIKHEHARAGRTFEYVIKV